MSDILMLSPRRAAAQAFASPRGIIFTNLEALLVLSVRGHRLQYIGARPQARGRYDRPRRRVAICLGRTQCLMVLERGRQRACKPKTRTGCRTCK
jgi:hypothetical protein